MADRIDVDSRPSLWRGALAGLAAGLVASLAMNGFQAAVQALAPTDDEDEPATQKAADRISVAATGSPLSDRAKPIAGDAVHYALGAALGIGYGVAAEFQPIVTAGFGTGFGTGAALLIDQAAVPLARIGPTPAETPPSTHLYTLSSHLVFGATAEATRRLMRALIGR